MNLVENLTNENRGVSPVVGVILMVAITVILAAVIGTFVLDLGSNVQQNPQAGVTFSEEGTDVVVQVISMENADEVRIEAGSVTYSNGSGPLDSVGQTATVDVSGGDETITAIGVLGDKEAVLQTYQYEA